MMCEGKVAIVTGAAGSGMGRSIALTLACEGAKVVINFRTSRGDADAIFSQISSRGGSATAIQADVFEAQGCHDLVYATVEHFGQVDIFVIGPGATWHPQPIEQLDAVSTLEDARRELAPLFHLLPLVLPGMYTRRWGRLIGIALHPTLLPPAYAYNAAKAARKHALLLAEDQAWAQGVTVNVIAPGPVPTIESLQKAIEQCDQGPAWQQRTAVSPQDVAEGVAFLCSEAGKFITGCVLPYR
jgi:3-oxoacyl-[acyl-carrier protein] reductase